MISFKRSRSGLPPRRVVGLKGQLLAIIRELHDEIGHRGNQSTFKHVRWRYQWEGLYEDDAEYVSGALEIGTKNR